MSFEHRTGTTMVRISGDTGKTLEHREVSVRQLGHAFEFGCTGFEVAAAEPAYQRLWLNLFDTATLPFYWGHYEPDRGLPRRAELMAAAQWFADRGVRRKGHPLVWHTVKAPWVDALPLSEAEDLLRGRIRREVADFAGVIDTWDAINEAVIMPRFINEPDGVPNAITRMCAAKGRIEMVRLAVEEARSVGTSPRLVLNDFDLGPEYEALVEAVLDADIEIDAIGLQSHMHQGFRGEDQLREISDRFGRFGLPLHWTETTLVSGDLMPAEIEDLNDHKVADWPSTDAGEARQADEIVRLYRTLVEHPAVASITYWGMGDTGAWLGAPAGLVRPDGTTKPAYHALHGLIRDEWWLKPSTVRTDVEGRFALSGFAGTYEITADARRAVVQLQPGEHHLDITLSAGSSGPDLLPPGVCETIC